MGRDIVAFASDQVDPWDNFQCKHYDHPLQPGDIWAELAKLCYYTFIGEYSMPREYFFVAPHGVGNKLSNLIRDPDKLKRELLELWDERCKTRITNTKAIPLDAKLRAHIESLDFKRIKTASPLTIIEEHRATPWHAARFGGGLPARPAAAGPPIAILPNETNYVRALFDAYEDRLGCAVASLDKLTDGALNAHFRRSRQEFYSAEALREFSKDNVSPGTFDGLLDEVHHGVVDVVDAAHADAVARVLATVQQAKSLILASNALFSRVNSSDKGGMCHQLANEQRVKWRP
jgi:hypothetical protein